ncbi:MAG: hypothetical protein KDD11_05075 [Acidobacteria bacterium]|nr:hypothetical protein [Acidobacteriota bacterium]
MLRDLDPDLRPGYGDPAEGAGLVVSGGKVFFDDNGPSSSGLWVSDGTASGTSLLRGAGYPQGIAPLPGGRVLVAGYGNQGERLFVTDGTAEGTSQLELPVPLDVSSSLRQLTAVGDRVFFTLGDLLGARSVWVSDGSEAGTVLLAEFGADDDSFQVTHLVASGDKLYFFVGPYGAAQELWKSDGTEAGTVLVRSLPSGGDLEGPQVVAAGSTTGGGLLFALEVSGAPCSLWRSDGTEAGTFEIRDFPQADHLCPREFGEADGQSFFTTGSVASFGATDVQQLWTTDGATADGTVLLHEWSGKANRPSSLTAFDDRLFFVVSGLGLWSSDGTPLGTEKVVATPVCSALAPAMTVFDGGLFFAANTTSGCEPFASDGTPAGTFQLGNLAPDVGSTVFDSAAYFDYTPFNEKSATHVEHKGELFFVTFDRSGQQLWAVRSNPWSADLLVDSVAVPDGADFYDLTPTAGDLFFITYPADIGKTRLWTTDGTPGGTREVPGTPEDVLSLGALGDKVCFIGITDELGGEPWCSDGTEAGTVLLGDLNPGPAGSIADYRGPWMKMGNRLAFCAETPRGLELWITDGTPGGTHRLSGVPGGALSLVPGSAAEIEGQTLFLAREATEVAGEKASGGEAVAGEALWLWRLGNEGDLVEPVVELAAPGAIVSASQGVAFRGRYFFIKNDGDTVHLMRSDGSAEGTEAVYDFGRQIYPFFADATAVGNDLFFTALTAEEGDELWATDGTAQGTRRVSDIAAGSNSASPRGLTAVRSHLVFTASDGVHGFEPWISDGTAEGTRMLADLAPGTESSNPEWYDVLGEDLVFDGWTHDVGRELRALTLGDIPARACGPRPGRVCLRDDRFEVLADWHDPRTGDIGRAEGSPYSNDTGELWFFNPDNLEMLVKVLDGSPVNGHGWVFYGSLTDLGVWLSVADLETGLTKTYVQEERETCGGSDTTAFPLGIFGEEPTQVGLLSPTSLSEQSSVIPASPVVIPAQSGIQGGGGGLDAPMSPLTGACTPSATTLCLLDGRFALELTWSDQRRPGRTGDGMAVPGTDRAGFFWFFRDANLELMVKVLDGRAVNGHFWVFYGSLTDVEFDLTVTDTSTGIAKTYHNPPGEQCGRSDTGAF